MNGLPYIELSAAFFGVLGTLLLAGRSRFAGWGFVAYLVSNAGWLFFSAERGLWALFAQQAVFTLVSGYGVWTWLLRPLEAQGGEVLTALQALHANMLAQDLEIQADRPTEAEYLACMEAARVAIDKAAWQKGGAA